MTHKYRLYGIPCSLYTAKARSYLRKHAIEFAEFSSSDDHYTQSIVPHIGRVIMPVLETPEGSLIQDSADIIQHLEARFSTGPSSPVLQAISLLFELFGGEGLLRPAMHYRWNFDEQNLGYLRSEFSCLKKANTDESTAAQFFDFASGRMRAAARAFGVSADSIPLIEESYRTFLSLFSRHLKSFPYLLGGSPTLGDYSLMGPLYAHLYRDPAPGLLMRQSAPSVARWVERMNSAEENWADHPADTALIDEQSLPDSLIALMAFIADDYLPEISAHIEFANRWLDERPTLPAGSNGFDKPTERAIGSAEFDWRGIRLTTSVMPYRFYLLQKLQDHYAQADTGNRKCIASIFADAGLQKLLTDRVKRRIERVNHLEVWGLPSKEAAQ